jgi:GH43 family beta-xylosidase
LFWLDKLRFSVIAFCFLSLTALYGAETYNNPIIADGADPWVFQKDEFYYYTHTTGGDVRVRKAARITGTNGLNAASAISVFTPLAPNNKNIWAPELHFLNGKWYIYYAADDGANANHRMYVAEALTSDPQGVYISRGKIYDSTDRWAIDGTVLQMDNGDLYFVWSGWPGSSDGQQNLYIAPMSNPWTISGPRVLIATPTYGWEGWIHEGPQIIKRNGKIFIVYSANASWTDEYCLGLLVNTNGNVLNPASWTKRSTPIFKKFSDLNGAVYGPGHCSFMKSIDLKEDLILYHAAKFSGAGWNRNVRVQRFSWHADDSPNLDVPIPTSVLLTVPSGEGPATNSTTTYSLTVNSGPGGVRVTPQQLRYKPGTVVTLVANNYAAIRFTGWTGDVWTTNSSISVTMDRNKTAVANFTRPLLVLDNANASFTGAWILSTNSLERFGADYHYAHTSNSITHTARYTPNIPAGGRYDIFALHSSGPNRSTSAPWQITSTEGTATVQVNQQLNGGIWNTLAAERKFGVGTNGFVQLANNTGENGKVVIADALAFVYSTHQDTAPFIYSQPLSQTVPPGGSVTLSVGFPGRPSCQWFFADQSIQGATNPMLTLTNFNNGNEGVYHAVVSNSFGMAISSNAWLRMDYPIRIESMARSSAPGFHAIGPIGSNYVIEASQDLEEWTPIQTNLVINGFWDFTVTGTSNAPYHFFRAVVR